MSREENNNRPQLPTSIMLFLRIFIGCYLCYLAYQITTGGDSSMNSALIYVFAAIFVIAGAGIVILSLKMIMKGEYQGGFGDISSTDNEEENFSEITAGLNEEKTTDNVDKSAL